MADAGTTIPRSCPGRSDREVARPPEPMACTSILRRARYRSHSHAWEPIRASSQSSLRALGREGIGRELTWSPLGGVVGRFAAGTGVEGNGLPILARLRNREKLGLEAKLVEGHLDVDQRNAEELLPIVGPVDSPLPELVMKLRFQLRRILGVDRKSCRERV